jgi:hypothetical protein
MNERHIYKSVTSSQHAVRDVLAALFTQELLVRSEEIVLVQPWISNVVILDNRSGNFDTLNPEWGKREVRLAEVLATLAAGDTRIHVVVRPDPHNKRFKSQLEDAMLDSGAGDRCTFYQIADLHTKGILCSHVLLRGSMNLTENGVGVLEESVSVTFDPHAIAAARVHFDSYIKS